MSFVRFRHLLPAALLAGIAVVPAIAQPVPASPLQRIERLERQVQQVQRRVFPQGQPADTAGFSIEPAATQASVSNLDNRLMALEQQLSTFLRQGEESAYKINQLESEIAQLRRQENRLRELEQRIATLSNRPAPAVAEIEPRPTRPSSTGGGSLPSRPSTSASTASEGPAVAAADDPAEAAYDVGYELWRDGKYDQAITALRAMASSFPRHRRVSWANNLAGRAMLDKGEPRAAAEALLANYRSNPKGERAADSLFYLGQSLMKLGQSSQACKAYAELEAVYGPTMRGELQRLLPPAKSAAGCN